MRTIQYLSPSSINLFKQDPKEFYLKYLSDIRPPELKQTNAMAAGSAFDAFVKSYLHSKLFGVGNDPRFDLKTIFEAQVQNHCRDEAWKVGEYLFKCYQITGALTDLALELTKAIGTPQFEIELKGAVEGYREGITKTYAWPSDLQTYKDKIPDLILLGKPDVFFINHQGCPVILDFKVNGYYSKTAPTPLAGYLKLRQPGETGYKSHRDCLPINHKGTLINRNKNLEDLKPDWALQLSVYSWLSGVNVGEDFIVAIDQLVCDTSYAEYLNGKPMVKIAEHRMRVHSNFQFEQFALIQDLWNRCHSGHYFTDLSFEESIEKCRMLDEVSRNLHKNEIEDDQWFNSNFRVR